MRVPAPHSPPGATGALSRRSLFRSTGGVLLSAGAALLLRGAGDAQAVLAARPAAFLPPPQTEASPAAAAPTQPAAAPPKALFVPPLIFARGDPNQPYVFLTYDDGYNGRAALDIAAAADALGVQVTFLPVGNVVNANPGLWRDIVSRGHGICNHTISHPYLTSLSYRQKEREILGGKEIQERVLQLSYPVTIMRPPFGKYDADVVAICRANGIRIVTGTVDSLGYTQGLDGSQRATAVAINSARRGLVTGGIVVAHCIPSDRNAAPQVLQAAVDAGLQPASLVDQIGA